MKKVNVNEWRDTNYKIRTITDNVPDDLFISCISYEPRSIGVVKKLCTDYRANTGLFITNEKFSKFIKLQENKNKLTKIIKSCSFFDNFEIIMCSIDNPIKIIIKIDNIIKSRFDNKKKINITCDITTFPRGELLTIIYYLCHLSIVGSLRLLYISPKRYGDWLSEGYSYLMIPPFFEGPPTFEKKTALLILTGFEYERAVSLIDEIEPSAIVLGKPQPGTSEDFVDVSEDIINRLRITRRIIKKIYNIPANNPFLCKKSLEKIIKENSLSYDFFVAPMGTKLEVIGTYLAYENNPNFRIVYPVPLVYNIGDYSSGCRDIYEITLK